MTVRRAMSWARLVLVCSMAVAWLFIASFVVAAASRSTSTDLASGAAPAPRSEQFQLERRAAEPRTNVREVSRTVMCPSCDTTLDQSSSPAAERMRAYVREAVDQGWSAEQIRDGLVDEYGGNEAILAVPRAQGIGLLVWIVPGGVVLVAAVVLVLTVRRWRRSSRGEVAA